jgi:hypothetical protein
LKSPEIINNIKSKIMSFKKTSINSPSKEKNIKKSTPKIDSEIPEEYEEQRSMALRIQPQPFKKILKSNLPQNKLNFKNDK